MLTQPLRQVLAWRGRSDLTAGSLVIKRMFSLGGGRSIRNPPREAASISKYPAVYRESLKEEFWRAAANELYWREGFRDVLKWDRTNDDSLLPNYTWFAGGKTNMAFNCLDWHVDHAGNGDRTALIHDSAMTGEVKKFTYSELRDEVARFAGVLRAQGVVKGDRVLIYMPMVPEATVAMLACLRIGAIHSVVFGGFASSELKTRIDDAKPKVVLAASCGLEPGRVVDYKALLDTALDKAHHSPDRCIVLQRPQHTASLVEGRDLSWADAVAGADSVQEVEWVESEHPSYILYTSGTTGAPKGIVRDTGGHMTTLKYSMKSIYNVDPGDTFWAASDIGWVVGHSYIVYAPLLHGCTSVMYEGKPGPHFWRVVERHRVRSLFTAPTALRAMRRDDPNGDLLKEYLYLAGERADPSTVEWGEMIFNNRVPIIDHFWQTETGWPIIATCVGLGEKRYKLGSSGRPVPGYEVEVVDYFGKPVDEGDTGALVLKLPLPPGVMKTLWERPQLAEETYFKKYPGYYNLGDSGYRDTDGFIHVMSRTDDIINCAGHRLSTGAIEEVLGQHPAVAECCAFGVVDHLKGHVPVGMVVLKAGVLADTANDEAISEVQDSVLGHVREHLGAVYAFKDCIVVQRLPKTRSGKILRKVLRQIADGEDEVKVPGTIEDMAVIPEVTEALTAHGFPNTK